MKTVTGVDEVGRGPLAGPVVACAVILPKDHMIEGLNDSKKLSKKKRAKLFPIIQKESTGIGIGIISRRVIDKINIREATFVAMRNALNRLPFKPSLAFIDGESLDDCIIPNEGVIKGDNLIDAIKAASIIAKVTRDKIMEDYSLIFPEYDFENNSGYGTKKHMDALRKYKASPIHRKSFKPVKLNMPTMAWLEENNLLSSLSVKLVSLFLYKNKYKIIELNFQFNRKNPVHIIAFRNRTIYLINVQESYITNQSIDKSVIKHFKSASDKYLKQKDDISNFELQIATILMTEKKKNINFFKINEL